MNRRRIAIGGLYQESHSFSPAPATMDEFLACVLLRGDETFEQLSGMIHEVAGALEVLSDYDCIPLLYGATAASGMPLRESCYEQLRTEYLSRVQNAMPLDGVVNDRARCDGGRADRRRDGRPNRGRQRDRGPEHFHNGFARPPCECHTADVTIRGRPRRGYHTAPHIDQKDTGARV